MPTFRNPILEGFSPDPSVCAVGEDYYLVTSTFSYFPGVPIYHSRDLVNWKQIGNILDRKEQLELLGAGHSQGIFAPSLRYHDGIFYMITTNVTHGGNFFVTAEDPAGPWSESYFLENAPGIDPSLFFDDDGRCYYIGTRPNPRGESYNGDWEVWLQELDLQKKQLTGVSTKLWKGALRDAIWPEGPHLYKKNGYYYLMIAEGGTGFNHCVTIARSRNIEGPYIGNKNNPILTHRHLGLSYPICNVGHGDLVKTSEDEWFITCLASRKYDGYSNLGRETFLAKVEWEEDWPVINPGEGRLLEEQKYYLDPAPVERKEMYSLDQPSVEFLYLRNPVEENYQWNVRDGWLRLYPTEVTIKEVGSPSYLGLRQQSMWYEFLAHLDISELQVHSEAGIVILQSDRYSIRIAAENTGEYVIIRMFTVIDGVEKIVESVSVNEKEFSLIFKGEGQYLSGFYMIGQNRQVIAEKIDIHYLSTEVAGGFVGCTLGIYCCGKKDAQNFVDFEWIEMKKV